MRSFRVRAKGMSETGGLQVGEDLPQDGLAGQFSPRAVAGDADEILAALAAKPVLRRDLQPGRKRIRILVVDHVPVENMPEPDMLREATLVVEKTIFGRSERQSLQGR